MRKILYLLAVVLIGIPVLAGPTEAQVRPWEISIAGGPSFATGDFSDVVDTGYHVQGSVGFDLPMLPIGARADLFWQELPDVEDEWFRQIGGLVNAVFEIPLVVIQPYGLAGVGVVRTEAPEVTHAGHTHATDSETTVGFNAGLGVEFPFLGMGGFVEGRYLNIFGGGNASDFRTIPVTFGIRF
jgi:hypothetical protein